VARKLSDELAALGWDGGEDEFRDIVGEVFAVLHPSWTDEDLYCEPRDAVRYCEAVRARTCQGVPDRLILRTLSNNRKRGWGERPLDGNEAV
jgi:hypothetical protein